jgi:hypothetical protein
VSARGARTLRPAVGDEDKAGLVGPVRAPLRGHYVTLAVEAQFAHEGRLVALQQVARARRRAPYM